jgi:hypothetical protein
VGSDDLRERKGTGVDPGPDVATAGHSAEDEGVDLCLGGCGRAQPAHAYDRGWRRGLCRACYRAAMGYLSTPFTRRYRSDPEKRERDRERSRRWKRENLGQPGRPAVTSSAGDSSSPRPGTNRVEFTDPAPATDTRPPSLDSPS